MSPATFLAASLLQLIRRAGVEHMPISKAIFNRVGVFPIIAHYYEPLFTTSVLKKPLFSERSLPGIDMNDHGQLAILKKFTFGEELLRLRTTSLTNSGPQFSFANTSFGSGDSEYLYNVIRLLKPKRLLEVGCGNSTLMARNAININREDDPSYECSHICIEPYEVSWLEKLPVKVIRQPVEDVDKSLFSELQENDILFIDSSHIIKPQGDVLFLFLEIIPSLRPGVLIHVHDVFTPRDYLKEWVTQQVKFWNEQYLLEALLTDTKSLEIVGALNYLKHKYPNELSAACPVLRTEIRHREPGSIWIRRK